MDAPAGNLAEFTEWDPDTYLREYFLTNVDGEPAVKFIVEAGRQLTGRPVAVDVGCGPTVCYWSAITPYVSGLYLADYLAINIERLRRWVTNDPRKFDWSTYTRFILEYEKSSPVGDAEVWTREALARSRVLGYLFCDVTRPDPLGPAHRRAYGCLSSFYCADSITTEKAQWRTYMRNIFSLLKPGGFFMGASMRNCRYYLVGGKAFPSANVNEVDWLELLLENGFDPNNLRIEVADEASQTSGPATFQPLREEYDQVVLVSGYLG